MRIGGSLFMIAAGAILAYAVTAHLSWIDIQTVGVILMIVGIIALALSIYWMTMRRRTDVVHYNNPAPYGDPNDAPYGQPYSQRTTTYEQGYYRQ